MYWLICRKPAHFLPAQMALVSTFFQMFIVLGMYNFAMSQKQLNTMRSISMIAYVSDSTIFRKMALWSRVVVVHSSKTLTKRTFAKTNFIAFFSAQKLQRFPRAIAGHKMLYFVRKKRKSSNRRQKNRQEKKRYLKQHQACSTRARRQASLVTQPQKQEINRMVTKLSYFIRSMESFLCRHSSFNVVFQAWTSNGTLI